MYFLKIIAIAIVLLVVLSGASFVHGKYFQNGPWPEGSVIRYYNGSDYRKTLEAAVWQWNRLDIPVSFQETDSKKDADLIIEQKSQAELDSEICDLESCLGHADIGYNPVRDFFQGSAKMYLLPPSSSFENKIQNSREIKTIIHELGHILGLKHPEEESCSIMSANSLCRKFSSKATSSQGTRYLCGPWMEDVKMIAELYKMDKVPRAESFCFDEVATSEWIINQYQSESYINLLLDSLKE